MVDAVEEIDTAAAPRRAGRAYWRAQGISELALSSFGLATEQEDRAGQRRAFYLLANFYGRTLRIVRSALAERKEALALAALGNLVTLHRPLTHMHRTAPAILPLALVVDRTARDDLARDLVVRVLSESPDALPAATVVERVNELDILGAVAPGTVVRLLTDLEATGHVRRANGGYGRATRTYTELDLGATSLRALLGPDLHDRLTADGY